MTPSPGGLDHGALGVADGLMENLIVAGQRPLHRLGVALPESSARLEVGEQENEHAGQI